MPPPPPVAESPKHQRFARLLDWARRGGCVLLTFGLVAWAWVFFRAETLGAAIDITVGMTGANGIGLTGFLADNRFGGATMIILCVLCACVAFFAPNSAALLERLRRAGFRGRLTAAFALGALLATCLVNIRHVASEFLYFQF